jgi:hypothetical protein
MSGNVGLGTNKGSWNALTNAPAISNSTQNNSAGDYYTTSVAGTSSFTSRGKGQYFAVGDIVVFNGAVWTKNDQFSAEAGFGTPSNWKDAYDNHITSGTFANNIITLNQRDGGSFTIDLTGVGGSSVLYRDSVTVSASSGQNAFTLSASIDHEDKTQVFIDGVYQQKTAYSVSGTSLTFDNSVVVPQGSTVEIISFSSVALTESLANAKIFVGDANANAIARTVSGDATLANTGALTLNASAKTTLGLNNVDNTSDANKPVSTATQSALDLKSNIASPTFTGTVGGITKAMVGLSNVDNTTDAGKPVSTATQSALDLKANLAGPTFTGNTSAANLTLTGYLNAPASFTIDPATHGDITGTVVIAGNLQVDGTQTTINSTTVSIDDLNLTLASGASSSSAANGAGITIDGASASLSYISSVDSFKFNKNLGINTNASYPLHVSGNIIAVEDSAPALRLIGGTTSFDLKSDGGVFKVRDVSGGNELYHIAAGGSGYHKWYINDSLKMTLNSSGVVGIGSTGIFAGTNAILNLQGIGIALKNDKNGSNNNWSYIQNTGTGSSSDINFYTGNNSSALNLSHSGDATFSKDVFINNANNNPRIELKQSGTTAGYFAIASGVNSIVNGSVSGDMTFRAVNKSVLFSVDNGVSSALTIKSDGKVGIGTTSPSHKLSVKQNSYASGSDAPEAALGITIGDYWTTTAGAALTIKNAGHRGSVGHASGSPLFRADFNNATGMILDKNGNVGIGRANPSSKLHLDGSNYNAASETQFTITDHGNNYNSGNTSCRIVMESRYWSGDDNVSTRSAITNIKDNGNGSSGSAMAFHTTNQGAGAYSEKMRISSGGDTTFSGTITANGSGNHAIGGNLYMASGTSIFTQGAGRVYTHNVTLREQDNTAKFQIYSSGGGCVFYNSESNGAYHFYTNGSERMRISSAGFVHLGGDAALVWGTNGATDPYIQAGSSGDELYFGRANGWQMAIKSDNVVDFKTGIRFLNGGNDTLDTYDEGTFSPYIQKNDSNGSGQLSSGSQTRVGRYIRVGNQVAIWIYIYMSAANAPATSGNTSWLVHGLPFTFRGSTPYQFLPCGYAMISSTNQEKHVRLQINSNADSGIIYGRSTLDTTNNNGNLIEFTFSGVLEIN